jgi:hypothetical protein
VTLLFDRWVQCFGEIYCLHLQSTVYMASSSSKRWYLRNCMASQPRRASSTHYHEDSTSYTIWTDVSLCYQEERTPLSTAMNLRRSDWLAKWLLVSEESLPIFLSRVVGTSASYAVKYRIQASIRKRAVLTFFKVLLSLAWPRPLLFASSPIHYSLITNHSIIRGYTAGATECVDKLN